MIHLDLIKQFLLKPASRLPASMACQGQDCPVGRWTDSEGLSECAFCPAGRIGLQAPGDMAEVTLSWKEFSLGSYISVHQED